MEPTSQAAVTPDTGGGRETPILQSPPAKPSSHHRPGVVPLVLTHSQTRDAMDDFWSFDWPNKSWQAPAVAAAWLIQSGANQSL